MSNLNKKMLNCGKGVTHPHLLPQHMNLPTCQVEIRNNGAEEQRIDWHQHTDGG
jgi:hypothetical protein